jgi:hypothetical protein
MAALKAVPPAAAEASESARLAVGLKRELIDLVKARDYVAALAVCEKRTGRPRPLRAPLRDFFRFVPLAVLARPP